MSRPALEEARAWLERAKADLVAADVDLAAEPVLVEDALFHCQQAVEKSMKAFLTARGQTFPKTHDLDVLATACENLEPGLFEPLGDVRSLSAFAWVFRYPGEWESPPVAEGADAMFLAESVYEAISGFLSDA